MIVCDLCGEAKECSQRLIEDREYDICADCWAPFAAKLHGKGRVRKHRAPVFLPSLPAEPEREEPKPGPGEPPKIWGGLPEVQ